MEEWLGDRCEICVYERGASLIEVDLVLMSDIWVRFGNTRTEPHRTMKEHIFKRGKLWL